MSPPAPPPGSPRVLIGAVWAGAAAALALGLSALAVWVALIRMPGVSYAGPFGTLSEHERTLESALKRDVQRLGGHDGGSSEGPPTPPGADPAPAADAIEGELRSAGLSVRRQRFEVGGWAGDNVEAEVPGRDGGEIVVVGARYGAAPETDDASGAAALLSLARAFAGAHPRRTLRFVAFADEAPPSLRTPAMGSAVYARRARAEGDRIVAVLSLGALGRYSDRPGGQRYPFPFGLFYPPVGDFVAFVGNPSSRGLVREALSAFRATARFPSEGVAAPGVGGSDPGAFWREGYPAVMITDTAPFRSPDVPGAGAAPHRLSYAPLARVVAGLARVVEDLAGR